MDQAAAPLYDGLQAYQARALLGFHMPGHTNGRAFDLGGLCGLDLTEVPLWPGGPLVPALVEQAEALAASYFGAGRTFFLTCGASIGVKAMLLGTCPPGAEVVIGRDCHKSAVDACILGDLRPRFIEPAFTSAWPFPLGVGRESLREALATGLPVLATTPTYQGVAWALPAAAEASASLLVDAAHGAHLAIGLAKPALPARAWVHGCHKTLGSLTQTGMLHVAAGVAAEPYLDWLERLGSTSPSYPLLASLDLARRWAAGPGRAAWERLHEARAALETKLLDRGVRFLAQGDLPPGAAVDPAKLSILAPQGGAAAARLLHAAHGIQVEAAGSNWLTLLLTPFHGPEEWARLAEGLTACLAGEAPTGAAAAWPTARPRRVLWPRQAALAPRRRLPLSQAAGLAAAEAICPYPPGIPWVWPGETLTGEVVRMAQAVLAAGGTVFGVDPAQTVAVVEG